MSKSMMWRSPRGPYGCGISQGDVVRYRGYAYTTGGFGVSLDGWCGYALIPIDGAPQVRHPDGVIRHVDVTDLEFVMDAKKAEWQKLKEYAP